ncbi:cell division protein ZapE [Marinobacterium marinum]|uniref:Cell division protein ZapE n=1 Tax=Marinobacterium marinum TaxID=2756129 RepID=A0A7W2ABA1_9GAMM|nr:cell division protein ZapE [Marinobacterium marinum]MBA4502736.1 cell division protein ZapE [Marinobacterium marinum]
MVQSSPVLRYRQALQDGFVSDPAQAHAVGLLQDCFERLQVQAADVSGLYMWGRVGRGKTWLMDLFQSDLSCASRRQHYHHFMRDIHQRLFRLNGTPDPLTVVAQELAAEVKVLCLDEFFVNDIGDAVVLGGLVQRLFDQGVVLVLTSNQPPEQLYSEGHNRERLQPAIDAIQTRMTVFALDGEQDHRLHPGISCQRYWLREEQPSALKDVFRTQNKGRIGRGRLELNNRPVDSLWHDEHQIWCTYDQLCEAPLAAAEYIELCDRFAHVLLSDVPVLTCQQHVADIARGTEDAVQLVAAGDRRLPKLTAKDNGVRRFIALVDECYDRGVPLWIEAEVAMDELYPDGHLSFAFRRTLSRLREMQFKRFGRG